MKCFLLLTIGICLAFLPAGTGTSAAKEEPAPAKPAVFVSFDRTNIRENDAVPVQVWFTNEWDKPLQSVNLQITGPDFLGWYQAPCQSLDSEEKLKQARIPGMGLALGSVNPNSVIHKTLCIKSDSNIVIGDFNVSLAFDYSWQKGNGLPHSVVTSEKTLKAGLLGSDSIAGVPLVLAGFIVPGLFFWLILTKFPLSKYAGFKWIPASLAPGDQLIYSIIVSFFIIWAGNSFKLSNLSNSISMAKLFSYAAQGLIYGLGTGLILWMFGWSLDKIKQKIQKKKDEAKAKEIVIGDELLLKLKKLLATQSSNNRTPRTTIKLKDGRTLVGSLAQQTSKSVVLAGWFQIDTTKLAGSGGDLTRFSELYNEGKWSEALEVAGNTNLGARLKIRELANGQERVAVENTEFLFIENDRVAKNGIEAKQDGAEEFLAIV